MGAVTPIHRGQAVDTSGTNMEDGPECGNTLPPAPEPELDRTLRRVPEEQPEVSPPARGFHQRRLASGLHLNEFMCAVTSRWHVVPGQRWSAQA
jgi:hypothetical protein